MLEETTNVQFVNLNSHLRDGNSLFESNQVCLLDDIFLCLVDSYVVGLMGSFVA